MSTLERIVPPLELCKRIPAGEFEDSALVWDIHGKFDKWHVEKRVKRSVRFGDYGRMSSPHADIPAPTLEETMTSLLNYAGWLLKIDSRFGLETFVELYSRTSNKCYVEYDPSACAAALRLWFKVKGIEVER